MPHYCRNQERPRLACKPQLTTSTWGNVLGARVCRTYWYLTCSCKRAVDWRSAAARLLNSSGRQPGGATLWVASAGAATVPHAHQRAAAAAGAAAAHLLIEPGPHLALHLERLLQQVRKCRPPRPAACCPCRRCCCRCCRCCCGDGGLGIRAGWGGAWEGSGAAAWDGCCARCARRARWALLGWRVLQVHLTRSREPTSGKPPQGSKEAPGRRRTHSGCKPSWATDSLRH